MPVLQAVVEETRRREAGLTTCRRGWTTCEEIERKFQRFCCSALPLSPPFRPTDREFTVVFSLCVRAFRLAKWGELHVSQGHETSEPASWRRKP